MICKNAEIVVDPHRRRCLDMSEDISLLSNPTLRYCPSIAECILLESGKADRKTIVAGRKGRSRSEEFLFGSISNKIVSHARNCTAWVVE
jgi:hypothetical protein